MAKKSSKTKGKKMSLPAVAEKRLRPYIEKGISKGIFSDATPVVEMFKRTAKQPDLVQTIKDLGGMKSEIAQDFITDAVMIDLTSILRQKKYTSHMEIWEKSNRSFPKADGTIRHACFIMGQTVIHDNGAAMEPAIFRMALWENEVALADDIVRGEQYVSEVACRNLNLEILDLKPLGGMSEFKPDKKFKHTSREELLRDLYEISDIADLADDVSRTPTDYRMIEATISYSGVKTSKNGNTFGSMLLKDDSSMSMEAIESGEDLFLNAICSLDLVAEFGKYSKILGLVTTKNSDQYGMSANLETAFGLVTIAPPQPEVETGGDDDDDDAADYFKTDDAVPMIGDDDDDDEDEDPEEDDSEDDDSEDDDDEAADEAEDKTEDEDPEEAEAEADDDDDWDDWDGDSWHDAP